jgi:hypothetical protein
MKRHLFAAVMAITSVISILPAAAGPYVINYRLNNVTFLDGGTAFGDFTVLFDPSSQYNGIEQLIAVDITTTPGTTFLGAHYNDPNFFQAGVQGPVKPIGQLGPWFNALVVGFVTPDLDNSLIFSFDQAIPISPTATLQLIATDAYPGERHGPGAGPVTDSVWRAFGTGSLVPVSVPEPATWAMLLGGLLLIYFGLRWRKLVAARD